jgi:outer membrane protein
VSSSDPNSCAGRVPGATLRDVRRAGGAVLGAIALLICQSQARAADPQSDLFQPDVFGTEGALRGRTAGFDDPFLRNCGPVAAALSISAAIDMALCRNPATRTAWAGAHQQAAAYGAAESAWLPDVSASGALSRVWGAHQDFNGVIVSEDQTTKDAAVNLSWTLYDFGGRDSRIRSARYLLDAAAATVNTVTQQTILLVVQSYYGVVAADAGQKAAAATEAAASRSLEIARTLQQGGVATVADVLQTQTAHDQARLSLVQATQTARIARGTLAVVLGFDADTPLELAAQPVPSQAPALAVRMEDLMAEAARQRPELAAARAERNAALEDITVARAVGRPSISLSAGRTGIDQTNVPNQNYGQIGLNVTIPLFTGFSVAYGVRQAQAQFRAREANAEQVRLAVTQDVWNAYYALDSANQQLATTATLMTSAQDNQDVAVGRYQSGVGTILDLLTAQGGAANARQLRVAAELNWQVSRAQLALALGRLTGAQPLGGDARLP